MSWEYSGENRRMIEFCLKWSFTKKPRPAETPVLVQSQICFKNFQIKCCYNLNRRVRAECGKRLPPRRGADTPGKAARNFVNILLNRFVDCYP
jgi:hypothetical protein